MKLPPAARCRIARTLTTLLSLSAAAVLPLPAAAADVVTHWVVQGARVGYADENLSGSFDYDTITGTITNWSLIMNGLFSSTTAFSPPPSHVLLPCASGCTGRNLPEIIAANGTRLEQVQFFDLADPAMAFYVGLTLPDGSSLGVPTGTMPTTIPLVPGYPASIMVVENSVNQGLGYSEIPLAGAIQYAGNSLAGIPGGPPTAPTSLGAYVVGNPKIGQLSSTLGGSNGKLAFYSFYTTGGAGWSASAVLTGAPATETYTFELVNAAGTVIQAVTLGPGNNWQGAVSMASLPAGTYGIGLYDDNPADPAFTIDFSSPVYAHRLDDDGPGRHHDH